MGGAYNKKYWSLQVSLVKKHILIKKNLFVLAG